MPPGVYSDLLVEVCLRLCGKRSMHHNDTDEKRTQLPKGASIPRSQVAGHKHKGRTRPGLLESDDGQILKAVQKPPRGTRELHFYEKIFEKDITDKDILQLRQFIPRFYHAYHFDEYPEVTYIKLENLVSTFRNPCVVDIKMGKKTYDPKAGPTKIVKEMTKFPHVKKFGFQFTGMQIYDPVQQKITFYDKFFCRSLGDDDILVKGLGTYFNIRNGLRKDAIRILLRKLKEIEKWFLSQRKFTFYASSLLMIYEGHSQQNDCYYECTNSEGNFEQTDSTVNLSSGVTDSSDIASSVTALSEIDISSNRTDSSSKSTSVSFSSVNIQAPMGCPSINNQNTVFADVRMIDFTHVFHVNEIDNNYLCGLQTLISNMQHLLEMPS